jgi:D-arginine dehydrogenase
LPEEAEVVIVGGGFAGAATAYYLSLLGAKGVVLVEASDQFGAHSSGKNAGMARQVTDDPITTQILKESVTAIRGMGQGFLDDRGSLLLCKEGAKILTVASMYPSLSKVLQKSDAVQMVNILDPCDFDLAVFTALDGAVDISSLLWHYLKGAKSRGVGLARLATVKEVLTEDGAVTGVVTEAGRIRCKIIVNAGGAFANQVGKMASLKEMPLTPYKRHLFVTPPLPFVVDSWPFVWDVTRGFYFKPECRGLLLSACDETPTTPDDEKSDPQTLDLLAQKMKDHCPPLFNIPIGRYWAGLRTFALDKRFVVGFDPLLRGFFWVAGLGGHGVTASAKVGEIAARMLLGLDVEKEIVSALSPARFLR